MITLHFKLAQKEDIESIFSIFTEAIHEMETNGIYQWDSVYPDRDMIKDDIKRGQLYFAKSDGVVLSAYVLNQECDAQYQDGRWKYPESTYYVIHRLCVNPKFQNRGIGTMTLLHIENELKKNAIETIRLDVFSLNPYAVKMYEKLRYQKVGTANWRMGEFYLMEKKL